MPPNQTLSALSASKGEEEKLRIENKALREQIESLKVKLTLAEIKNGGKAYLNPWIQSNVQL